MNPITLPIAELKSALTGLGKVINVKATLPILHHVKVERTSEGWIALTSTDLDRFVTVRLEHPAEGPPMAVLIPFDQLQGLTKNSSKDERLIIESIPQGTLIKFALANSLGASKIKPVPVTEFPQTPRLQAEPIPLSPELRRSIHEAMSCASKDVTRYVLNGTFIDASNPKANYIVGTDGRHLYTANSFALPLKDSVIIPTHKFLNWKEFNADGIWQLRAEKEHIQITTRRWRFITKTIEGTYPNWRVPIPNPKDAKTHIILDPDKLEALIKLIQRIPCPNEEYYTIGLEWKQQQQLILMGKGSNDEPWVKVPVPDAVGEGPDVTIFLNRKLLIKALEFGLNTIGLADELSPLRFFNKGKQMIVMPVRLNAESNPKPAPVKKAASQPPTQEMKTMITHPTPEEPAPNTQPPRIEDIFEGLNQIRESYIHNANKLKDLTNKLRFIHREHRNNEKEFHTVRSTLRSLQGLKL